MSSVPLGGITGETFGIASLITGFVHAIRTPKAVIEPKMIDMLALYGYPLSIAKLFKKLYISQESLELYVTFGNANAKYWLQKYIGYRLLNICKADSKTIASLKDIMSIYGITLDEALAILLAIRKGIRLVLLYRPKARRLANLIGLHGWGLKETVLASYYKGLLKKEEIHKISELTFTPKDLYRDILLRSGGE